VLLGVSCLVICWLWSDVVCSVLFHLSAYSCCMKFPSDFVSFCNLTVEIPESNLVV
jgi:hypothetical protein